MKTRQEYYNALSAGLNSNVWSELKDTMVGRELLSWGSELLYQNGAIVASLLNSLNWATCEDEFIPWAAFMNDCKLAFQIPLVITAKFDKNDKNYKEDLIAPFAIKYNVGLRQFTNIDVVDTTKKFSLYNGNYRVWSNAEIFVNFREGDSVSVTEPEASYSEEKAMVFCFDQLLYPNSVRVFYRNSDGVIIPAQEYGLDVDLEQPYYKVRMDRDLAQQIRLYNCEGLDIQIMWLEMTSVTETGLLLPDTIKISNCDCVAKVIGNEAFSYANLRRQIQKQLAARKGLFSYNNLRDFVNGFDGVADSNPVATAANEITVYFKPKQGTTMAVNEDEIVAELRENGEYFVNYKVQEGRCIMFNVMIHMLSQDLSDSVKSMITKAFESTKSILNYDNLQFRDVPTIQSLSEVISLYTNSVYNVYIAIKEDWNGKFSFTPIASTVKFYNNDELVAWDVDGKLVNTVSIQNPFDNLYESALYWYDTVLVEGSTAADISTGRVNTKVGSNNFIGSNFRVFKDYGVSYAEDSIKIINLKAFTDKQNGLAESDVNWSTNILTADEELLLNGWVLDGDLYGIQRTDGGISVIYRWSVVTNSLVKVPNWSFALPGTGWDMFLADDNNLCLYNAAAKRTFILENFKSEPRLVEIKDLGLTRSFTYFYYVADGVTILWAPTDRKLVMLSDFYHNEYNDGFFVIRNLNSVSTISENWKVRGSYNKGLWIVTESQKIYKLDVVKDTIEEVTQKWKQVEVLGYLSDDNSITSRINATRVEYATVALRNLSNDSYLKYNGILWN